MKKLITNVLADDNYYLKTKLKAQNQVSFLLKKYEEELKNVKSLNEKKSELENAYKTIEQKNRDLIDSLTYAKRIQEAVLPDKSLLNNLLEKYFIFNKPRDIVSGDFYWAGQKGGNIIIVVADSTGHGVPGAFMSLVGSMLLNKIINDQNFTMPSYVLYLFHKELRGILKQHANNYESIEDGLDIAICNIDLTKYEIQYAGANRPIYIGNGNNIVKIKGDPYGLGGYLLGLTRTFTNHHLKLKRGASIYMLTDGIADQFGGERGKKFTSKKLSELLTQVNEIPVFEKKEFVEKEFNKWKGIYPQTDDVLLFGMTI